jgi:hypothetical protein
VNNYGTLISEGIDLASPGQARNGGTVNNFGTWQLNGGFSAAIQFTNSIGATVNNFGNITNGAPLFLTNLGTLINTGSITANLINNPNNYLNIANSGTLINSGSIILGSFGGFGNSGTLINSGIIDGTGIYSGMFNGTGVYSQTAGQTINNGTLTMGSVIITAGTLSGTGTINAPVTLATGALLSPGTATTLGALTINGNLQSSGNLLFRISPVVGQFDVLRVNGNAAFTGGTMSFNFLNFTPHIGDSWDFLYASAITGWDTLSFFFSGLSSNETAQFHFHDGIETMRIVAVPEPSSSLLLGLGFGGLALWRRVKAA